MSADREAAIRLERERRHWTIPQWREAEGKDWPAANAQIRIDADAAVDSLLDEIAAVRQHLRTTQVALRATREREAKLWETLLREIERRLVEYEGWVGTLDTAVQKEMDDALADGEGEDKKINYRDLIEKLTEGRYDMECDCCRNTAKILSEGGLW